MDLSPGDKVVVIDEDLNGEVVAVVENEVRIYCEDGFEYTYQLHQIIKLSGKGSVEFVRKEYKFNEDSSISSYEAMKLFRTPVNLIGKKPVIDLHIEVLAPNKKFETLHEILNFQLDHVQEVLSAAASKRIRKLVFVHGVGKGVLREGLRSMLALKYPTVEFFDGSYHQFGAGATEVILHRFIDIK